MGRGMRAAEAFVADPDPAPYLHELVDAHPVPVILTDPLLTVLWSNVEGSQLLRGHRDFALRNGRLCLATQEATGAFRQFLESQANGVRAWLYVNDDACWLIRIQRLFPLGRSPGYAFTIFPSGRDLPYVWPELDALGLTAAECRVLKGLLNGRAAQDLAEDLAISSETVRTHIRRIYAKLGVSNREQLFYRTLTLRTL